jgi:hypothetical protein
LPIALLDKTRTQLLTKDLNANFASIELATSVLR